MLTLKSIAGVALVLAVTACSHGPSPAPIGSHKAPANRAATLPSPARHIEGR